MDIDCNIVDDLSSLDNCDKLVFSTSFTEKNIENSLDKILDYEKQHDLKLVLNFKKLSFDTRLCICKYILTHYDITNGTLLLNAINMIKSYNQLDETFFNNENVICNSIMEFLDIKNKCVEQIQQYINDLIKCYLSIFKSLHKIELNYLDDAKEIDKSFFKLIFNLDFYTLSGIFSKAKNINTDDLYVIDNAYAIFSALVEKQNKVNQVLSKLL